MRFLTAVFVALFVLFVLPTALASEAPSCSQITTGSPAAHSGDPAWLKVGRPDSFGNFTWCRTTTDVPAKPSHTEPVPAYTTFDEMVAISWADQAAAQLPTKDPRISQKGTLSPQAASEIGKKLRVLHWERWPREKRGSRLNTIYGGWLLGTTTGDVYRTFRALDAGAKEDSFLFADEGKGSVLIGEFATSFAIWEGSRTLRNISCKRPGMFPRFGCFLGHVFPVAAGGVRIAIAQHNKKITDELRRR